MFDVLLKKIKDDILRLFIHSIPEWFSPLMCTYVAFCFGIFAVIAAYYYLVTISFYCWILNRFFDGLDGNFPINFRVGFIARERK